VKGNGRAFPSSPHALRSSFSSKYIKTVAGARDDGGLILIRDDGIVTAKSV
jgi:hypothetical protein